MCTVNPWQTPSDTQRGTMGVISYLGTGLGMGPSDDETQQQKSELASLHPAGYPDPELHRREQADLSRVQLQLVYGPKNGTEISRA